MRDETRDATEVELATGNSERAASEVDVGTDLSGQEVTTDALLKNEANTQEIKRVTKGSIKIYIRADLAKDKTIFSEESSLAIFGMGKVELIELKKTSIQCPPCLHHVFEGATACKCGKLQRPNKNVMDRIKEAFEALKAPYYRTSPIITRGSKCGPHPWQQHHHKVRNAFRSASKCDKNFSSIWDRWQQDEIYKKSQLSRNLTDARVRHLDFIVHVDISHNAPSWQRERHVNLIHLRSLDSNKQAGPLWERPGF